MGPMLAELNEYVLTEPIAKLTRHMASRDFSHPDHDGYHVPLKVRRLRDAAAIVEGSRQAPMFGMPEDTSVMSLAKLALHCYPNKALSSW